MEGADSNDMEPKTLREDVKSEDMGAGSKPNFDNGSDENGSKPIDSKTDDGEDSKKGTDSEMNEYAYLEREGFTSELYKVKLSNLTKHVSYSQLKKQIEAKKLKPRKIKLFGDDSFGGTYAFITFANEEDRGEAIKALDGHQWKGRYLAAKKAKPKADPLIQMQRKRRNQGQGEGEPEGKKEKDPDDDLPVEERLKNSVIPLWKLSYEEQLETKNTSMRDFIKKLGRSMDRNNRDLSKWMARQREANGGLCCKLEPIKPSPIQEGYRNKSEFTIGKSIDGNERIVGFRYGKYRAGTCSVGEPSACRNISAKSLELTHAFQTFIRSNPWDAFDPATSEGHWRMLLVRTTNIGDIMASAEFHPQNLSKEELTKVKETLIEYFTKGPGAAAGVTGMFFHPSSEKITGTGEKSKRELLFGKPQIQEKLLDMTFQISPDAFFQVNTLGAEVLYSTVNDWCDISPNATVLDVCCGTGTIGLTMAKHVKKVIGVDICKEAIDDAKVNAQMNGVTNVEYHCGKAEDVMPGIMRNLFTRDIIAVVDPPRAGLNQRVIQSIRRCPNIDKLIYISCNPNAALQNFESLLRPTSKKMKGLPFVPIRAVPVDLFPDTVHCELVVLFQRYSDKLLTSVTESTETVDPNKPKETSSTGLEGEKVEESAMETAEATSCTVEDEFAAKDDTDE